MKHILQSTAIVLLLIFITSCSHSQVTKSNTVASEEPKRDNMPRRPEIAKISFTDGKTKSANNSSYTEIISATDAKLHAKQPILLHQKLKK